MKTSIDTKAQETKDYVKYVLSEALKPRRNTEEGFVRVHVIEGVTAFPKIKEELDNFSGRNYFETDEASADRRKSAVFIEIMNFTDKLFPRTRNPLGPHADLKDRIEITFFFDLERVEKLRTKLEKRTPVVTPEKPKTKTQTTNDKTDKRIVLCINMDGDLYVEKEPQRLYEMGTKSDGYKVLYFLPKDNKYCQTVDIMNYLKKPDEQSVRTAIGEIRTNINNELDLNEKKIMEGKKGKGYRINPKYKIKVVQD